METDYTKRELDAKFGEVHDRFSRQDQTLEKILVQTTAHNGRMKKLETYKSFTQGAIAVLTVLVIPILIFVVSNWMQHKN